MPLFFSAAVFTEIQNALQVKLTTVAVAKFIGAFTGGGQFLGVLGVSGEVF